MDPLQAGDPEAVGRYRLLGRLGEGGMGRVYLGRTPEGQQNEFTKARASLVEARAAVEASDPLTAEAYSAGIQHVVDASGNLALAAQLVGQIELPARYREAGSVEPACAP